jgi:hypothetical protein
MMVTMALESIPYGLDMSRVWGVERNEIAVELGIFTENRNNNDNIHSIHCNMYFCITIILYYDYYIYNGLCIHP